MTNIIQKIAFRGTEHHPDAPIIEMENVSIAYESVGFSFAAPEMHNALEAISFQVETGEHIAVIGPNGAGKSTIFKLIAGILKPDTGRVRMFGISPDKHICIAYVPQKDHIDRTFPVTVKDVVMMGRIRQIGLFNRPDKADWQAVYAALERVDALPIADEQIGELSGGQQQRVYIARTLAMHADLLLLDEPLAGLDAPSRQAIFTILDSLRPDGVTVLLATHDLHLAAERFDRVMLLNRRLLAFGPAEDVLRTENLLAAYSGQVGPH
jgi:ABC-type Mn2+/Zn2+ transport system ATPase subunit